MKKVTNKTILKQGENTYQPIEIDGVIYWVDLKQKIDSGYYIAIDNSINKHNKNYFRLDNDKKIVAQSQNKLEGVPVISLDSYVFNFLDKACSDWHRQEYGFVANVPIRKAFVEGYNSNQNKWSDADVLKAIELAREENGWSDNSMEYTYTKEKIIEQINQIEVINIDSQFNILSYE